jgi:UDP-N-acetylmuramoyl-L-alanyl-D-glutamate--2,6-diaminopimelate ligase
MELFAQMVEEGCQYVVMEVSSFGLIQQRVGCIHFDVAVFTNLTQDHLDYHGTMENYYQAKKLLFNICDKAIINIDDDYGRRLYKETPCYFKYSYSVKQKADYYAYEVKLHSRGSQFKFNYYNNVEDYWSTALVDIKIPGMFNVSNMTAALTVCQCLELDMYKCFPAVHNYKGTCGRAEVLPTPSDFTVICDYAHTPDALENILKTVKSFSEGKICCLFGCGGNRDIGKREIMGEIASRYADRLVITSDNPRDEDPDLIIDDVVKGVFKPYVRIADRYEAVIYALKNAKKNDIILLAGKGHEDYQVMRNDEHVHLDEHEIVRDFFSEKISMNNV